MVRAFLDIDTQIDFLYPAGSLYVPDAESVIPVIAKLNRFARDKYLPLISTVCAHGENDSEFRRWPPHCVLGTVGQQKPAVLQVGQRIFEKQDTDLFASPASEALVQEAAAEQWVVYGVVSEVCVQQAVMGLLERGKRVMVVEDAVKESKPGAAQHFWAMLKERGGSVTRSADLLSEA